MSKSDGKNLVRHYRHRLHWLDSAIGTTEGWLAEQEGQTTPAMVENAQATLSALQAEQELLKQRKDRGENYRSQRATKGAEREVKQFLASSDSHLAAGFEENYSAQREILESAVNDADPDRLLAVCLEARKSFAKFGWPEDWERWDNAARSAGLDLPSPELDEIGPAQEEPPWQGAEDD